MSFLISNRRSVRETPAERQKIWRNKFRSQCEERVKQVRQQQIDSIRKDKWLTNIILQEWQQFQKEHEEAFKQEEYNVYNDIESMIEDSLNETNMNNNDDGYAQYEEYEKLQQNELEMAIEAFENSTNPNLICMKCQNPSQFIETNNQYQCSLCNYHIDNKVFNEIQSIIQTHRTTCQNTIAFTIEPGNESSILGFCNECDLWVAFLNERKV